MKQIRIPLLLPVLIFGIFVIILTLSGLENKFKSQKYFLKKPKCTDVHVATVIVGGKLGNNIWEYMSLFSIINLYGDKINFVPYVPEMLKARLLYVFERISIRGRSELPRSCLNMQEPYVLNVTASLDFDVFSRNHRCPLILAKYSARYKEIIQYGVNKIKNELGFHKRHKTYSYKVFSKLKARFKLQSKNVTFVGVHYRGTDYNYLLRNKYNKSIKDLPKYTFYLQAMNYFKRKYETVVFILITVDFQWLEENISFLQKNNNVVVNPNHQDLVKDLVLLSQCNHSIINYGTFGTTTALFTEGTTFVYDLGVPIDHRGPTVAMGIAKMLPNWHLL